MRALSPRPRDADFWGRPPSQGPDATFARQQPVFRRGARGLSAGPQRTKDADSLKSPTSPLPTGSPKDQPFFLKGVSQQVPGAKAAVPKLQAPDGRLPSFPRSARARPPSPRATGIDAPQPVQRPSTARRAPVPTPRAATPITPRRPASAAARPSPRPNPPIPRQRPPTAPIKPRPASSIGRRPPPQQGRSTPTTMRCTFGTPITRKAVPIVLPLEDPLDSESSEDDEEAALCIFWQNVRRLQVQAILASSRDEYDSTRSEAGGFCDSMNFAAERPTSAVRSRTHQRGRGAWMENYESCDNDCPPLLQQSAASSRMSSKASASVHPSPCGVAVHPHQVEKRSTAELLRRDAQHVRSCATSSPFPPTFRQLRPGEQPPCGDGISLRLWRCPPDVTLEVLCLIHPDDVCALLVASKTTRAACSVHTSTGWHTVLPHLILTSKLCGTPLKRIWLPRTLWLEGRDLDSSACRSLLAGLECTGSRAARALLTLDLRNTKVCNPISLVSVTRACRSLCSLNVSRTRLRDLGASHLLGGLVFDPLTGSRSPHPALRVLALEDNRLTAAIGRELARVVVETPLEVLLLASNELGDEGVEAIAAGIAERPDPLQLRDGNGGGGRLTRLDVSRNRLSSSGLAALVSSLSCNRTLRILEAGGNEKIGSSIAASTDCAASLASGLMSAKALEEIHLWKCGLGDAGYNLIAESLPPNIAVVNLATNDFSSTHVKMIAASSRGIIRL